ncbi:MAG: class D beta-lactamase [Bdellovibrio sp.]|nr:class D beta-lactamase [Bdellovibrio sp.]
MENAYAANPNFEKHFKDKEGCFILYDLKAKKRLVTFNEKRCSERYVACSTFKIPLAVMGFDSGILKDENTTFKWDGKNHGILDWNRNHTVASWIKYSVVWFSQQLTPKLGLDAIQSYLKKFGYGNQDMSAGLTTAWLTSGENPSLKVSAEEQLHFFERLWTDQLPVSKHAMELTRKVTYLETSPHGSTIYGKTGSGLPTKYYFGWFVAHLKSGEREYISVLNFDGPTQKDAKKFGGIEARLMTKEILTEMELW